MILNGRANLPSGTLEMSGDIFHYHILKKKNASGIYWAGDSDKHPVMFGTVSYKKSWLVQMSIPPL